MVKTVVFNWFLTVKKCFLQCLRTLQPKQKAIEFLSLWMELSLLIYPTSLPLILMESITFIFMEFITSWYEIEKGTIVIISIYWLWLITLVTFHTNLNPQYYRLERHSSIGKRTTRFAIFHTKRISRILIPTHKIIVYWNAELRKSQSDVDVHLGSFLGTKTRQWRWMQTIPLTAFLFANPKESNALKNNRNPTTKTWLKIWVLADVYVSHKWNCNNLSAKKAGEPVKNYNGN